MLYELYSVERMLGQLLEAEVLPAGSELEYAIRLRGRLLTHPQLSGLVRIVPRGVRYPHHDGGPAEREDGLGGMFFDRFVLAGVSNPETWPTDAEAAAARQRNEQVIRSKRFNEHLSEEHTRDLIAFGARDSNVPAALLELADLVRSKLYPRLAVVCQEAIDRFGYWRPIDDDEREV